MIDASMTFALASAGSWNAVPMFSAFVLGSSIVLILSVKNGVGGFAKLDIICVLIALVGLAVWRMNAQGNPEVAVLANMLAGTTGTIPNIIKAYRDPESEDLTAWTMFLIGGFFNSLTIPEFTLIRAGGTLLVFGLQICLFTALVLGRRAHKK
ncbi:MAG: hypothetical protein WA051_01120 [Minisyncoccia bacterium]